MSRVVANTLRWPTHLLWLQGIMMAFAIVVQQRAGVGCPYNLGNVKKNMFQ